MKKIKILIAGIGGVGGYFGGKLAAHYANSIEVEVYFIARGENERVIREKGLYVESTKGNFTAHPKIVTSNPAEAGIVDLILCCTKGYDLESTMEQLKPCINERTVILPVLNGVDPYEKIKNVLPQNEVWEGCVYIVSRLFAPGHVKETGNITILDFGAQNGTYEKLQLFHNILNKAGFEARLSPNILDTIWEKYSFIATVATLTAFLDTNIGTILETEDYKKLLLSLFEELLAVAKAHGVKLPENIVQKNLDIMASLPYETTASMHTDYLNGKPTEVDSITGYMVKLGKKLKVPTPTYERIYEALQQRSSLPLG